MNHWKLTGITASVLLLLSGCSKPVLSPETEAFPESAITSEESESALEDPSSDFTESALPAVPKITSQPDTVPSGMVLYSSLPLFLEENEWELQMFVPEGSLDGQTLMLDDNCHFYIRAVSGDDSYVFLDEHIQLGIPEADVWTDAGNNLHIVLRDIRTAGCRITDYVYNPAENSFSGTVLLAEDGINFWGTLR